MAGDEVHLGAAARVERSGIALVHEGEFIVAAPDAEADLVPGGAASADGGATEVHYWFPVQVEVVGLDDVTAGAVIARVFDELNRELGARG